MMSATARDAGIEALKQGDPQGAVQHLMVAARQNPNDVQAQAYLGTAYGQLGMLAEATEALGRAVSLAPQSAALQYNHGVALEKSGRRDDAVAAYRRSVALDGGYERARQALTRLGESTQAPAPVSAPAVATPAPAAGAPAVPAPATPAAPVPPAAAVTGLADFALGPDTSGQQAGGGHAEVTIAGGSPSDPTLQGSAWASASAPTMYGAPAADVQPQTPWAAAPGPQPLGDWTPAPQPGGGGLADYQSAPPRAPQTTSSYSPPAGDTMMATVAAPERDLPRSWMLGHSYLAGMGIGAWWGAIGAVIFLLLALTVVTASQLTRMGLPLMVMALVIVAVGVLIWGLVGLFGGMSEDAETVCSWLGVGVGVLTSLFLLPLAMQLLHIGAGGMAGTIIVSRLFGKGLGGKINEMQSTVFVVASAGNVAMVRGR